MTENAILDALRQRFAAPLPEFHERRIVFWVDPQAECVDMIADLQMPGVHVVPLTGTNNFAIKRLLVDTDTHSNFLVYQPFPTPDIHEDWLADVRLYSEQFAADLVSIRLQQLGAAPDAALRQTVRQYGRFFDSKERVARLRAFGSSYTSAGQLVLDILAVTVGSDNTEADILRAVLLAGPEENAPLATLEKQGAAEAFWQLAARHTGYAEDAASVWGLTRHLLCAALAAQLPEETLPNLGGGCAKTSAAQRAQCYALLQVWLALPQQQEQLYDLALRAQSELALPEALQRLETAHLQQADCLPCVEVCLLQRAYAQFENPAPRAADIQQLVDGRRTRPWYRLLAPYYECVYQAAAMQLFYLGHAGGFHHAQAAEAWQAYTDDYYKMDSAYRAFHLAFSQCLTAACPALEDLPKELAEWAEHLYRDWFLHGLGQNWMAVTRAAFAENAQLPGIVQQTEFYRRTVRPAMEYGRVYVVISDALRYEVAAELATQLTRSTRGTATLRAVQAGFPSLTQYGMAALLPHRQLTLAEDGRVLCDGMPTKTLEDRSKVLQAHCPAGVAVHYRDLTAMRQADRRKLVSGSKVVYIYHNAIDAVGDKPQTEDRVFAACGTAVAELKNLVRMIANELSGTQVFLTADHGFLYNYQPLRQTDRAAAQPVSGAVVDQGTRWLLAAAGSKMDNALPVSLAYLGSTLQGFAPYADVRLQCAGGGVRYVHGGLSLQELAVPVVVFKSHRGSAQTAQPAQLELLTPSRTISNNIFALDFYQKQAVAGKVLPTTYTLYFTNAAGEEVSDRQSVIADRTEPEPPDRKFRLRFSLKSGVYRQTDAHWLVITQAQDGAVVQRIPFVIDITFRDEFDF